MWATRATREPPVHGDTRRASAVAGVTVTAPIASVGAAPDDRPTETRKSARAVRADARGAPPADGTPPTTGSALGATLAGDTRKPELLAVRGVPCASRGSLCPLAKRALVSTTAIRGRGRLTWRVPRDSGHERNRVSEKAKHDFSFETLGSSFGKRGFTGRSDQLRFHFFLSRFFFAFSVFARSRHTARGKSARAASPGSRRASLFVAASSRRERIDAR
jgi:hypothetical protein